MKQSAARKAVPSSVSEDPIPTFGGVFPDGAFLDLVRNGASMRPRLLLWDGREQIVDDDVEYRGQRYEPHAIHETFLRELKLPAQVGTSGPVREFLPEICKLIDRFVSLPEKSTALVGRFILATWLVDAMQTAPRMLIEGPDTARAHQLMQLLHCCCRRAVPMSCGNPGRIVLPPERHAPDLAPATGRDISEARSSPKRRRRSRESNSPSRATAGFIRSPSGPVRRGVSTRAFG